MSSKAVQFFVRSPHHFVHSCILAALLAGAVAAAVSTGGARADLTTASQRQRVTHEWIRAAAMDPKIQAGGEAVLALDPETQVREVYRHYSEILRASGHDLTLELGGFQTILAEDYDDYRWLDLITLNLGSRIGITSSGAQAPWLEEPIINFEPRWEEFNEGAQVSAVERRRVLEGLSVLEVVARWIDSKEVRSLPPAISTYRVHLRYAGHQRTYQASVVWLEGSQGQGYDPSFFDSIVSRLNDLDAGGRRIVSQKLWEDLYGSPLHPPQ